MIDKTAPTSVRQQILNIEKKIKFNASPVMAKKIATKKNKTTELLGEKIVNDLSQVQRHIQFFNLRIKP